MKGEEEGGGGEGGREEEGGREKEGERGEEGGIREAHVEEEDGEISVSVYCKDITVCGHLI